MNKFYDLQTWRGLLNRPKQSICVAPVVCLVEKDDNILLNVLFKVNNLMQFSIPCVLKDIFKNVLAIRLKSDNGLYPNQVHIRITH